VRLCAGLCSVAAAVCWVVLCVPQQRDSILQYEVLRHDAAVGRAGSAAPDIPIVLQLYAIYFSLIFVRKHQLHMYVGLG
jgi:hypothetical protein